MDLKEKTRQEPPPPPQKRIDGKNSVIKPLCFVSSWNKSKEEWKKQWDKNKEPKENNKLRQKGGKKRQERDREKQWKRGRPNKAKEREGRHSKINQNALVGENQGLFLLKAKKRKEKRTRQPKNRNK